MSELMGEVIQRWTMKRQAALVTKNLPGRRTMTPAEASSAA